MKIIIREYRAEDAGQVAGVYRDSYSTLRQSRGGMHPDKALDRLPERTDGEISRTLTEGGILMVAEIRKNGEIIGTHGFSTGPINTFLKSSYARSMFVKERFQRGRSGVNVGRLLSQATQKRARELGFRKWYGLSTPESLEYHKKHGWRHFPKYDMVYLDGMVKVSYVELELRKSVWNPIRIEPYIIMFFMALARLRALIRGVRPP